MVLFNHPDFYPTPPDLASRMLSGVPLADDDEMKYILEPSAGDGKLIEAIESTAQRLGAKRKDIDAIELQQDFRHILEGKEYRVVHDDFLTFRTLKQYDLIVANPPFSDGDRHLLKMLEMQEPHGGAVVCLLNAETLRNPCTLIRKDLLRKLTDAGASIEYIEGAFVDAERPTGVEVALIKVYYPTPEKHSVILEGMKQEEHYEELSQGHPLVDNDKIKAIVQRHQYEVRAGIKLIREYYAMRDSILPDEFDDKHPTPIIMLEVHHSARFYGATCLINEYVQQVRRKYWRALFRMKEFSGKLTSNLSSEFYNRVEELKDYDFSYYNIMELKIQISKLLVRGVEESIETLFHQLSEKHHYYDETSKNIHYYNGWKTNKAWYINRRVIIPLNSWPPAYKGKYKPTENSLLRKFMDMEQALNYLDGGLTEFYSAERGLQHAENTGKTQKIVLKYFIITFYKKGTCHFEFTDLDLLKKLNIYGSRRRNWLPPSYGKVAYDNMSVEEQAVVDSFEGKESYEDTLRRRDYFLCDTSDFIPMLEAGNEELKEQEA